MERLTDEQRERVAELVPLALKLAERWCFRRLIGGARRAEVRSAFLFGLMVAVRTYDSERGASLKTHVYLKAPRAALDALRAEWGRAGSARAALRARSVPIRFGYNPIVYERSGRAHRLYSREVPPDVRALDADTIAGVRRSLSADHARVLLETVVDGKLVEEVANEMGVQKSRASGLRAEAVELLKIGGFMRRAFE